jgi:predicted alpha/beta hydrolase
VDAAAESTNLPGWFYSGGARTRPLLLCTNGYDETIQTMHYGSAAAAQRRGYHVLTFDGPGRDAYSSKTAYFAPGLGDGRSRSYSTSP